MLGGVAVRYADATDEELAGWEATSDLGETNTEFRNGRILYRLGEAAIQLLEDNSEHPPLLFMGGYGHLSGLRRGLRAHHISHRVHHYNRRPVVEVPTLIHRFNPGLIPPSFEQWCDTRDVRAWQKNFSKQSTNS